MNIPNFDTVRTRRLAVTFKELSIGDAIALNTIPIEEHERASTEFLTAVVSSCDGLPNARDWTVGERALAVAQYMSACNGGEPDFIIGKGHYSDYLNAERDVELDNDGVAKAIDIGVVGGDNWKMRHLTGRMAQAVERIKGEVKLPGGGVLSGYAHWELGCMASQLFRADDAAPPEGEGLCDEWLVHRMNVLLLFPQRLYADLRERFYEGWDTLNHLFNMALSADGVVMLSREAGSGLPPVRFHVHALLSRDARGLA